MAKSGQARVITPEQFQHVLEIVKTKRHPEKNIALLQISMRLGLRVQEISLLQVKEVARLAPEKSSVFRNFTLNEMLRLPASYTKGANALRKSTQRYQRTKLNFTVEQFDQICAQIESLVKAGATIVPETFYPPLKEHKGKSRDLPLIDAELREALQNYLEVRLLQEPNLKASSPLFISQKKTPYSPNTLQEHFALMWRDWGGVEGGQSHSGRRSLLTSIMRSNTSGNSIKIAQKIAGHKSGATTLIYAEPGEEDLAQALLESNRLLGTLPL